MEPSFLTAGIVLLVLPTVATVLFLLTPFARTYPRVRGLLSRFVYVGSAALGLMVGVNLGLIKKIDAREAPRYRVTMKGWRSHPDVREVRAIYDEIKSSMKSKAYQVTTRNFDVDSPSCATYPVREESLAADPEGRVRLYRVEQIISHREPMTIERYYDAKGVLRFVFEKMPASTVRIYLDGAGSVLWAVEQSGDEDTVYAASAEDWEMKPGTGKAAKDEFLAPQPCPELTR